MSRDKLLKRLDIQEGIEGSTPNIRALRDVVGILRTAMQWQMLTTVGWHRYGKNSFETHRFYYATDELWELLRYMEEK